MSELRQLDLDVMDYIRERFRETGFSPTSAEISNRFEIGRGGSTNKVFTSLESAGLIVFEEGRKRYIPTCWRELAGANVSALEYELSVSNERFQKAKADNDKLRKKIADFEKADPLASVREQARIRAQRFRDKKKKAKN